MVSPQVVHEKLNYFWVSSTTNRLFMGFKVYFDVISKKC